MTVISMVTVGNRFSGGQRTLAQNREYAAVNAKKQMEVPTKITSFMVPEDAMRTVHRLVKACR